MTPLVDEFEVLVQDLDAVVRAVGDEQAALRVERQGVRSHELAGPGPLPADRLDELPVLRYPHQAVAVLLPAGWPRPVAVGDDDVAVRGDGARRRTDERILARPRDARLAEAQQQLPVGAELVHLEAAAVRLRTVAERTAVARPQVAVVVHAEAVRRHDRAFADALRDLAGRVDVVERRLRAVQHPQAAGVVRQKTDGRAPGLARPQRGPVLDHPVRIGHRGGRPYRQQLRRGRIGIVARTLAGRVRCGEQHGAGDYGRRPGPRLQIRSHSQPSAIRPRRPWRPGPNQRPAASSIRAPASIAVRA